MPDDNKSDEAMPSARADITATTRAVGRELEQLLRTPPAAALYLVATPIGHLGDMSLRAIAILARADLVYCEDTRTSRVLFQRFGISRSLRSYHEHSPPAVRDEILAALGRGRSVALISDAGMPGVSDPGFKLVRAAVDAGYTVFPVPGPSAFVAAVVASGLPTDQFLFAGFLPQKSGARQRTLAGLRELPFTLVFYESPHRVAEVLVDMAETFGPRPAVVAREITKRFEEMRRGSLDELAAWAAAAPVRGEVAIVVGPPSNDAGDVTDEIIAERLSIELETASPSQAAKRVAEALGVPKARVYGVGLSVKRGDP